MIIKCNFFLKYTLSILIKHGKYIFLGYCFTPYQRLWLYNGAPLVAFYDTLGIRRTYSRLKPPAHGKYINKKKIGTNVHVNT